MASSARFAHTEMRRSLLFSRLMTSVGRSADLSLGREEAETPVGNGAPDTGHFGRVPFVLAWWVTCVVTGGTANYHPLFAGGGWAVGAGGKEWFSF